MKTDTHQRQPIHSKVWQALRQFPHAIAQGSKNPPQHTGAAAAAILSATFSCFFMMVIQHLTLMSKIWEKWVWSIGSWMPGSHASNPLYGNIGPYSGKETLLIVSWLVSWSILHQLLKHREVKPILISTFTIGFLVAATVMAWHPFFPYAPIF